MRAVRHYIVENRLGSVQWERNASAARSRAKAHAFDSTSAAQAYRQKG